MGKGGEEPAAWGGLSRFNAPGLGGEVEVSPEAWAHLVFRKVQFPGPNSPKIPHPKPPLVHGRTKHHISLRGGKLVLRLLVLLCVRTIRTTLYGIDEGHVLFRAEGVDHVVDLVQDALGFVLVFFKFKFGISKVGKASSVAKVKYHSEMRKYKAVP